MRNDYYGEGNGTQMEMDKEMGRVAAGADARLAAKPTTETIHNLTQKLRR